jgi:hypothetical protein
MCYSTGAIATANIADVTDREGHGPTVLGRYRFSARYGRHRHRLPRELEMNPAAHQPPERSCQRADEKAHNRRQKTARQLKNGADAEMPTAVAATLGRLTGRFLLGVWPLGP